LVNGFGEARSERGPKSQGWKPEGPTAGAGLLGRSSQLEGMGKHCKLLSMVRGGAPAAKVFSRILNTQDDLSGQQDDGSRRFYFPAVW